MVLICRVFQNTPSYLQPFFPWKTDLLGALSPWVVIKYARFRCPRDISVCSHFKAFMNLCLIILKTWLFEYCGQPCFIGFGSFGFCLMFFLNIARWLLADFFFHSKSLFWQNLRRWWLALNVGNFLNQYYKRTGIMKALRHHQVFLKLVEFTSSLEQCGPCYGPFLKDWLRRAATQWRKLMQF